MNELKQAMQSINITDLDSLVPKIREYIETNLNLMNISKFTEQYNEYLSKINETQDKLLSSMDLEKIKEYKLFLSNIYDEISNETRNPQGQSRRHHRNRQAMPLQMHREVQTSETSLYFSNHIFFYQIVQ